MHLFSEAGQWIWLLSCRLGTDKTQQEASQSRKRDPGSQGRSVIAASPFDLEKREKSAPRTLFPSVAAQFCALYPLRLTPSPALPSYGRACPGILGTCPHTIQPAVQVASSTEGAREFKDGVPSGEPSFLWPSV